MSQKNPEEIIKTSREKISQIDRDILSLVKQREELSIAIGRAKQKLSIPPRDFSREKEVFLSAKNIAKELDLSISFALSLQELILKGSLSRQEEDRIKQNKEGKKSVLVIGGAGRLGTWLCHFFFDIGHQVVVMDIKKPPFDCPYITTIDASANNFDLIAIATPIRASIDIIEQLIKFSIKRPVIFDVSSVKTPVHQALLKLRENGSLITSLHPMFGPSVELLFGKHIIRCSLGAKKADDEAKDLFSPTSLTMVDMSIDDHDAIIAILLGLAHVINIVFVRAIQKSSYNISQLSRFSSPTFAHLLDIAKKVMGENPHLYYEIQALNPHSRRVYQMLEQSLAETVKAVKEIDEESFVDIMKQANHFLTGIT